MVHSRRLTLVVTLSALACAQQPAMPVDAAPSVAPAAAGGVLPDLMTRVAAGANPANLMAHLGIAGRPESMPLLVSVDGKAAEARPALAALGFAVQRVTGAAAVVVGPLSSVPGLLAQPFVRTVIPLPGGRPATESQALLMAGATEYTDGTPPISGDGVSVAVIDTGFLGLGTVVGAGELPAGFTTLDCDATACAEGDIESGSTEAHGVAMAEVIHDVAPGAVLTLVRNKESAAALPEILDELIARGVKVALLAVAYAPFGPMDGRDPIGVHEALSRARAAGMVVVTAAGNGANKVYQHVYVDEGFGTHTFNSDVDGDSLNDFYLQTGERIEVFLSWDEWDPVDVGAAVARDDLDVFIKLRQPSGLIDQARQAQDPNNIQPGQAFGGQSVQDGQGFPLEHVVFVAREAGTHWLQVARKAGSPAQPGRRFRLEIWSKGTMQYITPLGSLAFPADGEDVIAVGAANWRDGIAEDLFSAQGPTADGRIKPDVTGYDRVQTTSLANTRPLLAGTSVAAAHVAGAAVLYRASNPDATPAQVQQALGDHAAAAGPTGKDQIYGAGLLGLPLRQAPVVNIVRPNGVQFASVGKFDSPVRFTADVEVNSAMTGDFVPRLTRTDFAATVGGLPATVASSTRNISWYTLTIVPPPQAAPGRFDLNVSVPLLDATASDITPQSVSYLSTHRFVQVGLVLDRSGSMYGDPIERAKEAASYFVELMSVGDYVAVASFDDSAWLDFPLTLLAEPVAGAPLLQDGLEAGTSGWTLAGTWAVEPGTGYGASNALSDSPSSLYANNVDASAKLAAPLDTSGMTVPFLRFWVSTSLSTNDRLEVETSNNDADWYSLRTLRGYATGHFEEVSLPQSATTWLRFRLISDGVGIGDGVAIDDVEVREGPTTSSIQQAAAAIAAIQPGGATSVGGGLRVMQDELAAHRQAGGDPAIVLMSDGQENSPPYVNTVLPDVIANGFRVFTIALGAADWSQMQDIARATGAEAYYAGDPSELLDIYQSISTALSSRGTILREVVSTVPQETRSFTARLDDDMVEAIFAVRWNTAGEPFRLVLHAPDGTTWNAATAADPASYSSGEKYARFQVSPPAAGEWTLDVSWLADVGHVPPTQTYTVEVQVQTATILQVDVDPPLPTRGSPITIMAAISGRAVSPASHATAKVYRSDAWKHRLLLADDGLGGDRLADDGIFSARLWGSPVTGTYDVQVNIVVNPVTGASRVASRRIRVEGSTDRDGDGLTDVWEQEHGTDPLVADADQDPDGDGMTNAAEFLSCTRPLIYDTDGDSLSDGTEVASLSSQGTRTDPIYPDSDEDGVPDGIEVAQGGDPRDGSDGVDGGLGRMELDPADMDFGVVTPGVTRDIRMYLSNIGTTTLQPTASITGDGGAAFSIVETSLPSALPHGRVTSLVVRFAPPSEDVWTGNLAIGSAGGVLRDVPLRGQTPTTVVVDAGPPPDAFVPDAADSGPPDAGRTPDAGQVADAGHAVQDAGVSSSSSVPGAPDAGGRGRGCGCSTEEEPVDAAAPVMMLLLALSVLRVRRPR